MDKFTCVQDIGDLKTAVAEALEIKRDRFQFTGLGRNTLSRVKSTSVV